MEPVPLFPKAKLTKNLDETVFPSRLTLVQVTTETAKFILFYHSYTFENKFNDQNLQRFELYKYNELDLALLNITRPFLVHLQFAKFWILH